MSKLDCATALCSWGMSSSKEITKKVASKKSDPDKAGQDALSFSDYPGCSPGGGDCFAAILQTADRSRSHTRGLQDDTDEINLILRRRARRPPEDGVQLSFLLTPAGILLSWVKHHDKPPRFDLTMTSDPELVIDGLGLNVEPERLAEIKKAYKDKKGIYKNSK